MVILSTTINLDNNYVIKVIDNINEIPKETVDIINLKLSNLLEKKEIILKIDFSKIKPDEYKKALRRLLHIKKMLLKRKIEIGKPDSTRRLLGIVINYNDTDKNQTDFISAINAISYNTRYERYNYIYDAVCDYLDGFFYGKNFCDFKNNRCGEKRNVNSDSSVGCCHHYKNRFLGPLLPHNLILCEHLKDDYTCGARCIGCKLFTCDYLEKKGIKFRIKDILLLDVFFNPLQKYFIKTMVFTPKEKVLKRLLIL